MEYDTKSKKTDIKYGNLRAIKILNDYLFNKENFLHIFSKIFDELKFVKIFQYKIT